MFKFGKLVNAREKPTGLLSRVIRTGAALSFLMAFASGLAVAQEVPSQVTLFKNVKVFDGINDGLKDVDVLVVKNKIHKIAKDIPESGTWEVDIRSKAKRLANPAGGMEGYSFTVQTESGVQTKKVKVNIVDGGGRTLMPGLIDSHVHFNMYKDGTLVDLQNSTWEEIGARAAAMAKELLAMGFTTVRDTCGAHDGLRKVIDAGLLEGPRIYLSGGCLSQTGGHGDWGIAGQRKGESNLERLETTRLLDGRAEVLQGARRNFALGANFLKIMVSGGVTSVKDPIYQSGFSDDEIAAAVETAADYDSYVMMHVFQDSDLARALNLGVKVVDHGLNITEKTMQLMVEKEAFFSPNLTALSQAAIDHPMHQDPTFPPTQKFMQLRKESVNLFDLVKKYQPKMVFNTDYVLLTGVPYRQSVDFTKYFVAKTFGNFEALKSLTSTGGELAALTGRGNPYPEKLGVIEVGAYADILIVDGNPLEDIRAIGAADKWFDAEPRGQDVPSIKVIMKDGKIYKNTLN